MKIIWSSLAIDRVIEIAKYIAEDNLISSQKWVVSILETVEKLQDFPKIGRIVAEISQDDFREIIHGNYRIIYKLQSDNVSILTVKNSRQILSTNEIKSP